MKLVITASVGDTLFVQWPKESRQHLSDYYTNVQIRICCGAWKSKKIKAIVSRASLSSFVKNWTERKQNQKFGFKIGNSRELVYIKIAVSRDRKKCWIYGHIGESNFKNKLVFSMDASLKNVQVKA